MSLILANTNSVYVLYMLLSICLSVCLSSVGFVHPNEAIEIFGIVPMPFNTLAIWRHPGKIIWRSSQGNLSVGRVKHKRGSQI